ncbi:MAG: hypothetical protein RIB98_14325 [Acidimicrobiales bacterium]
MTKRVLRVGLIALSVVAVAPLIWWMASALPDDLTADQVRDADYLWAPPVLSAGQRHGIGIASLFVVVLAATVLVQGLRTDRFQPGWLRVVVPLAGVAAYAGVTYAVATEPVTGANIGGGLMILAGFVLVPTLLGFAIFAAVQLRRSAR